MKKIAFVPILAVLGLGLAACNKTADTTNTSSVETNTVVEESDANFSAVDGIDTANDTDLGNAELSNGTTNAQ
ncbi:hypothetical protein C8J47_0442 [Sphingomonas sp. PP-F2F-G114-C0414]|uniref:hypothetical protein n=1 Tax=Sphingomonas sp. PP-F2F-G114-C0414 TaxID=2135662 RepID=UPI000EF8FB80|nr:hypothetical protein [Sphingomonas sp. PP-F2F-G114-C0414]RMB36864.1 hypothetical protein C8J47_0442 [Sphingomonas sp. PP-F2F-G114-C0414]